MKLYLFALALSLVLAPAAARGAPSVDTIVNKANHAAYYQGKSGRAQVKMTITDRGGSKRVRRMTVLRKNQGADDGDQKFYVYFHEPADVAKTVFMVHKKVGSEDDRWLYLPSLDLVKRIAAADKRTSFVGSDFVYEDVSGRNVKADRHKLVKTTDKYYVVESTPRSRGRVRFSRYTTYIHKSTFLPTKTEYYDRRGRKYRVMTVNKVSRVQGHPTITKITIRDLSSRSKTVVQYRNVRYGLSLPDRIFTERYLRRMPVRYMR
jgi:outer membrane lipoprotein-sorting protein